MSRIRKGIRSASVRRVEPPTSGGWWAGLRRDERWCVAWRTEAMPASSFFYFRSRVAAEQFAASVRGVS